MPLWNNTDREESKPTWLTAAQKRWCVRTNAGWELPVSSGISTVSGQFRGVKTATGLTTYIPETELLVTMPLNPSSTGATSSIFANRATSIAVGFTSTSDTPNYAPYITCPFAGDSYTAGGPNSTGVSHDYTSNYGINPYGVSTLKWGVTSLGLSGGTGYVKVQANDTNFTNNLTLSLAGVTGPTGGGGYVGLNTIVMYTNANLLDTTKVPAAVYEAFFGPTSTYGSDIGVIVLPKGLTSGTYGLTAQVVDGSLTGTSKFFVTVL